MMSLARAERLRLVAAARRAGEEAPTLCEGWTTRDLATHLVIREREPVAALGIAVPAFAGRLAAKESDYRSMPYSELLGLVASPPTWTPGAWPGLGSVMNTVEYLVHHEDIRRAELEWFPRRLSRGDQDTVWTQCRRVLLPAAAKAKRRLEIVSPGLGRRAAGRGEPTTVTGEPVEILLWLMGRTDHALVDVR